MKIMITTPDTENIDYGVSFVEVVSLSAANCPFKVHTITQDPEDADAILFINRGRGEYRELLRKNSLVKNFFYKSFIYEAADSPIDFMRGIYISMLKSRFDPKRHRAFSYLTSASEFIEPYAQSYAHQPDLLFSFMGAATSPVRKTLFVESSDTLIENTSAWSNWKPDDPLRRERTKRYAETLARSKFVLCPRGIGTSSYRLFETMQMGRVPVIIPDAWVPPEGPDWESFSIRVAENRIAEIPEILNLYLDRYEEMGKKARQAWEDWFSPTVLFHRLAENISSLISTDYILDKRELYRWPLLALQWQFRRESRHHVLRKLALEFMKVVKFKFYLATPSEDFKTNILNKTDK